MRVKGATSGLIGSLIVHVVLLTAMGMIHYQLQADQPEIVVETFFSEERTQEEFSQELQQEQVVAETASLVSSSSAVSSANVGGAVGSSVTQTNIATSDSLKDPDINVNVGEITMVGTGEISDEVGESLIDGGSAVVGDYSVALGRITQELIRLMRQQKVLVVWLFDESDSMKDDQQEIRANFHKVYEELGIQAKQDEKLKRAEDVLLTVVGSFGESLHFINEKPSSDVKEIQSAIDKVPIDESGIENMCQSIAATIDKYILTAQRGERKLVLVVVSDESGDDGQHVEVAVEKAKKAKSPIYVLGREAVFGYPYARIRWKDPKYGLDHWLRINRGPETAWPEALQWDGFHARWDVYNSGFGPYEQVRLAKESGGVFYVLPGEEENLVGAGAQERRKFDFLDMKEYEPLLESRRAYEEERNASKFRSTIWNVILTLNPHLDDKLNIRHHHYSIDPVEFRKQGAVEFQQATRAMMLCNEAVKLLDDIKPLRDEEASSRWRANYDLALAQLMCYRVRLFQFLLAMDDHMASGRKPSKPKSNEWHIQRARKMLEPDDRQYQAIKAAFKLNQSKEAFLGELKEQERKSRELFQFVMDEHPRTPWARRAEAELAMGYGMTFIEAFHDPRYANIGREITLPKP